jgi:2-polyprenyl-6-methoxyphenol hydroxylase-like FAD-dependent oxidoreductase
LVLLGDAAADFLPNADIGASIAMESAAVLAGELSHSDTGYLEQALGLFVKRRRHRVERTQEDSRRLARTVFVKSATVAQIRDLVTHCYSIDGLAGSIAQAFEEPI